MTQDLVAWPDYILPPEPLNESYAHKLPSRVNRTPMEQGLPRQRRVIRNAATQFQVRWPFSPDQYRAFIGMLDAVDGGQFTIPVFRDNAYVWVTAQFVADSVQAAREGGEWMVSAVLETMDRMAPSDTELGALLITAGSDDSLEDIVDQLYQLVHVDLPGALS